MSETNASRSTKAIHFLAGGRHYAVELHYVKEVLRAVECEAMTELPPFVVGMINLRGEVIPVIDFLERAGGGKTQMKSSSRMMVVRIKNLLVGLLVEEIREVFESSEISNQFQSETIIDPKYISGSILHLGDTLILVDMEKLLTDKEFKKLEAKHA